MLYEYSSYLHEKSLFYLARRNSGRGPPPPDLKGGGVLASLVY